MQVISLFRLYAPLKPRVVLDIVERFSLCLMLCVVAFRNLLELRGAESEFAEGFILPKSFGWFRGNNVLWTISYVSDMTCYVGQVFDLFLPLACVDCHAL